MILKKEIFRDDYILRIYKIVDKMDRELEHLNLDIARKYQQLGVLGVFRTEVLELDLQVEKIMGSVFLKKMKQHPTVIRALQECHLELVKFTRRWNIFLQKKVMYRNLEYHVYDMIFMDITNEEFREYVLGKKKGALLRNTLMTMKEFLKGIKEDFQFPIKKENFSIHEQNIKECLDQWSLEDARDGELDVSEETFSYERKKTS